MIHTGRFRESTLSSIGRFENNSVAGHFLQTTILGSDKMKDMLDRLKNLTDNEERLAIAITYATSQQIAQVTSETKQKLDISAEAIEEIRATQQGVFCYTHSGFSS